MARMRRKSEVWLKYGFRKGLDALTGLRCIKNKSQVIAHILGLHKENYITYHLKSGLRLKVQDKTSILSINDILDDKVYSILQSQDIRIILDIGANIGVYSLYSALQHPNAKILSYEPDPYNYSLLCNNVKNNALKNRIFPYKKALAKENGELPFFRDQTSPRAHSLVCESRDKIIVESTNLETIFNKFKIKKCDILKMDIEGAEYEVLYNCPDTLFDKIETIMVECHNNFTSMDYICTKDNMKKFLASKSFKVIRDKGSVLTARRI